MFALEVFRVDIQRCKIDAIDEILRRQFGKTDWVRTAMPVKMDSAASPVVQPFAERPGEGRTIALMKFRQPDENIGIIEQPSQGIEFVVRRRGRVFSKDHAGNVSTR